MNRTLLTLLATAAFTAATSATIGACTSSPKPVAPTEGAAAASGSAAAASGGDVVSTSAGDVTITPIFHASVMFQTGGSTIYVDPFTANGAIDYAKYPKADFVLITDIHFDHMDDKALTALVQPTTMIIAPPAVAAQLKGRSNVTILKNGETKDLALFSVEAVPMYNLVRGPEAGKLFHDKGRGNGYVLTIGGKRIYLSGDTECTPEMKGLASIDVAFVCMNLPYTMPPSEAAVCVNAFKPKVLYPYHYAVPGKADSTSNLDELTSSIDSSAHVEVRKRAWYPK